MPINANCQPGRGSRFSVVCLLGVAAASVLFTVGCGSMKANSLISQGQDAMKAQQFKQATADFEQALQLDPNSVQAKHLLATAYQSQIVPDAPLEVNKPVAAQAAASFQQVLAKNPNSAADLAGLGAVKIAMGDLDGARADLQKALKLDPSNPDIYNSLGATEYREIDRQVSAVRYQLGATDTDAPIADTNAPASDVKACMAVHDKYAAEDDAAIGYVQKAVSMRADFDEAMTNLNLLYRQKADLTCGRNQTERTADLATANTWSDKAVGLRKLAMAKQQVQGGVVDDTQPKEDQQ